MVLRFLLLFGAAIAAAGFVSCRSAGDGTLAAEPGDTPAFFGPGRTRLEFGAWPAVRFAPTSWVMTAPERNRVKEAARLPAPDRRWLVIGVGDDEVPAEHGRQQGLARALTVRRALMEFGVDPHAILVAGLAAHEAAGVTGREDSGPRVEWALVR